MANVLSKLAVVITANSSQMVGQLNAANKQIGVLNKTLLNLKKQLIGTFGAYQVVRAIGTAISTIADFEKQMDKVRAISGATGKEFDDLEQNALELGRTTEYTARQIAGLQVEYARLGFSTKEILQSTKATLDLATATGEDLAMSAEIAGATLRGFGLDASEMGRVTDVIAGSLNQSALALDSFADGMKYVAPVAAATNVTIEETSAMLSILADAGIKGSQAGTSLRRIFTLLNQSGKPLAERMKELADQGITLANANDEVGLYAQTALLVLARQNDKVRELSETFGDLNGEAQRTADIMRDNLVGDVDKFTSALEGLILEGSTLNGLFRNLTQSGTSLINMFSGARDAAKEYQSALHAFRTGGSFRDRVFGRDLEGDLEVLRQLRKEAGLTGSGANGPNPYKAEIAGLDFFANELVKKTAEEARLRREAAEAAEKQRIEMEKAARIALELSEIERGARIATLERSFGVSSQTLGGFTSTNPQVDASFNESVAASYDSITAAIERSAKAAEKNNAAINEQNNAYIRLAGAASDAIAQGIAGEKSFAQVLAGTTASVIDNLERQALAGIIAKSVASGKNPIAAIIGATLGFAAIKGLFARISRGGGSSSGGGYDPVYARANGRQKVDVVGTIRGRDIEIQSVEQGRVTGRTKANG